MKIAIPVNNGILAEHFGHCPHFDLYTIENNLVTQTELVEAPPHEPGLLPRWLSEKGVTDVIAGGMGQRAIEIFKSHHVNVFTGAPKISSQELVTGFMDKTLTFSVNYCDH
jgi:predicted Fe-Mo cluster-binding NifX family protein